jgi:hypothetical protein
MRVFNPALHTQLIDAKVMSKMAAGNKDVMLDKPLEAVCAGPIN